MQKIVDAMKVVCSILTEDPDGGPDRIPFEIFKKIYFYLAGLGDDVKQTEIDNVISYLEDEV